MAIRKLTESDKRDIIDLYRQPGETTITLGYRYGVSNSTISRMLKNTLPADEYEQLLQQKRLNAGSLAADTRAHNKTAGHQKNTELSSDVILSIGLKDIAMEQTGVDRKVKRRSSSLKSNLETIELSIQSPEQQLNHSTVLWDESPLMDRDYVPMTDDLLDDDDEPDEDGLDDLSEDLEEDDFGDLEEDGAGFQLNTQWGYGNNLKVLPLSKASLPRPCYLVIDRAAELVTCPLSMFGNVDQTDTQDVRQQTLPIFDNHRVARQFSHRNQQVIKVPDGQLLQKTTAYLQAKGITRLFLDGQIYSLTD
ncbi:MAG: hypothetical protein ACKO3I_07575 [Synechococcales cyanobacterium]